MMARFLSISDKPPLPPPKPPPPEPWPDWMNPANALRLCAALSLLVLGGLTWTLVAVAPGRWSGGVLLYVAVLAGAREGRRWPGALAILIALGVLGCVVLGFGLVLMSVGFAMTRSGVESSQLLFLILVVVGILHVLLLAAGGLVCFSPRPARPATRPR